MKSTQIVMARVTRPKSAHRTDCICASCKESPNVFSGRRSPGNSHLHIANKIRNTLRAVALPQNDKNEKKC